jgi:ribosomal protein S1
MKRIVINEIIGNELRSREQAQRLFLNVNSKSKIIFDFRGITYISRSFADEFFNLNKAFSASCINVEDKLDKIFLSVSMTQNKFKSKVHINIAKPKNVAELTSLLCVY